MLIYPRIVSVTFVPDLPWGVKDPCWKGSIFSWLRVQLPLPLFHRFLSSVQFGASDFTTIYWRILCLWWFSWRDLKKKNYFPPSLTSVSLSGFFLTNYRGELLKQLCSCSCSNMLINLAVCIQSLMGPVLWLARTAKGFEVRIRSLLDLPVTSDHPREQSWCQHSSRCRWGSGTAWVWASILNSPGSQVFCSPAYIPVHSRWCRVILKKGVETGRCRIYF